jgi:polyisoprenoid-binding protein YceI
MSIKTHLSIAAAAVGLLFSVNVSQAQLAVGSAGAKKVTLNDHVSKNQFMWISEAPLENIKGSSEGVTGAFTIDPKNLSTLRGTISTQVKTMKTGNGTRDNHLMGAAWLDAGKYPAITFTILSVSEVKASGATATAVATGDFTMHGVTKRMTIPFKLTYMQESDKTRERAPGDLVMIAANFDVSLKDYKITGSEGLVGSKVGQNIKITAQIFGNTN